MELTINQKKYRITGLTVIIIFVAFASIFSYHVYTTHISLVKYPPAGELVKVGDYRLHMYSAGEKRDLPTVILESGSGTPSSYSDWRYIQPELAKITRVISYDRAGYGWSDSASNERTSEQIVEDLQNMLEVSGESGPYILVGHSFGGFNMQLFAHRYPNQVAGLVLLDSSLIGKTPRVSDTGLLLQASLRKVGLMRVMGQLGMLPVPEAVISDGRSEQFLYQHFYNKDQRSELKHMSTTDEQRLKTVQKEGLGDLPIQILSSRAEEKEYKDWQASQDSLLKLSSASKRIIVEDSGHYIHHDQPEMVIKTIVDIINQTKK
jgi:pimeloyl-ACP methyl ester carboxylesterase